jgi:hypothetical protein
MARFASAGMNTTVNVRSLLPPVLDGTTLVDDDDAFASAVDLGGIVFSVIGISTHV